MRFRSGFPRLITNLGRAEPDRTMAQSPMSLPGGCHRAIPPRSGVCSGRPCTAVALVSAVEHPDEGLGPPLRIGEYGSPQRIRLKRPSQNPTRRRVLVGAELGHLEMLLSRHVQPIMPREPDGSAGSLSG